MHTLVCMCMYVRACAIPVLQTLKYLHIVYEREWQHFSERLLRMEGVKAALSKGKDSGFKPTIQDIRDTSFLPGELTLMRAGEGAVH